MNHKHHCGIAIPPDWKPNGEAPEHPEMWESLWDWYYGKQNGIANGVPHTEVDTLIEALDSDNERERLNAAYRLGADRRRCRAYLETGVTRYI